MDEYDEKTKDIEPQNCGKIKDGGWIGIFMNGLQFRNVVGTHIMVQLAHAQFG